MHDVFELAATALFGFYKQNGGLKTLSFQLPQDRGKAYALACSAGINAIELIKAIDDSQLIMRQKNGELSLEDFVLLVLAANFEVTGKQISKAERLSSGTRQALKLLPEQLEVVEMQDIGESHIWLRVPRGVLPPEASIPHSLLSNFVRLEMNATVTSDEKERCIAESLSSGLPVYALVSCLKDASQMVLLDACAAPGSKTLQASELFSRVIACERDRNRAEVLKKRCISIKNVEVIEGDAFDAFKAQKFDCILLDPTCSGSGTFSVDQNIADVLGCSKTRANAIQLASFEVKILKAALDSGCSAVSYSTCSVFDEENEQVVEQVLEDYAEKYELANALPKWPLRGIRHPECLRSGPEMLSEGFFVAVFTKR